MKVIVTKNYEQLSQKANEIIRGVLAKKPNAVLGLATGSTPAGLYALMVQDCKSGLTSYKNAVTFNLDEYIGLDAAHEQSYSYYMRKHLFSHIDISAKNTHIPAGTAPDVQAECARYNALLQKFVPDIQILGLGGNGHIGFNEPGTPFDSVTHAVNLNAETRQANARFFNSINEVPRRAITMGISNILAAKSILVLASGAAKATAVSDMLAGEIHPRCPATALQKHGSVTVIADEAAASVMRENIGYRVEKLVDYYF